MITIFNHKKAPVSTDFYTLYDHNVTSFIFTPIASKGLLKNSWSNTVYTCHKTTKNLNQDAVSLFGLLIYSVLQIMFLPWQCGTARFEMKGVLAKIWQQQIPIFFITYFMMSNLILMTHL